jgi:diadenylate cyclase
MMSRFKIGGLIVVERETSLAEFAESGTRIDAIVNAELLAAIFTPKGPLHDGAVIVREGRAWAAGCTLPLSQAKSQVQSLGMRHRAALGITEETDGLAVVISEESHKISMAMRGQLTPPLDAETLEDMLVEQTGRGGGVSGKRT